MTAATMGPTRSPENVRQGFAWRPGSVSFQTLDEARDIDIEVVRTPTLDETASRATRIIDVTFTVPGSGNIEVSLISSGVALALPPGECSMRFEHGLGVDRRMWARLLICPVKTGGAARESSGSR